MHGGSLESLLQDRLDAPPDGRRVAFARHEYQAGEESPERVATQEETHTLAILQIEYAYCYARQVGNGALEELVPRKGVEYVQQRLTPVACRGHVGTLDDLLDLVAQQRDIARTFAISGRRKQADEAAFAARLARFIEFLDADVVEVHMTMDGGAGVRLGQYQPVLGPCEALHFACQLHGLVLATFVVGQETQPAAFDRPQEDLVLAVGQLVLTIAEEREMVADHPLQQFLALRA